MHLVYENIAQYMLKHWIGLFFKDSTLNIQPYVLIKKQWNEIESQKLGISKFLSQIWDIG